MSKIIYAVFLFTFILNFLAVNCFDNLEDYSSFYDLIAKGKKDQRIARSGKIPPELSGTFKAKPKHIPRIGRTTNDANFDETLYRLWTGADDVSHIEKRSNLNFDDDQMEYIQRNPNEIEFWKKLFGTKTEMDFK